MGNSTLHAGPITVDTRHRRVSVNGRSIHLTDVEYRLLVVLIREPGRTRSRVHLYRQVWKGNPTKDSRTVAMHISRLRGKLGRAAKLIKTVEGVGYRFEV